MPKQIAPGLIVETVEDILDRGNEEMNAITKTENAPVGLLDIIERAVRDPSIDVEKMERLFALQKEAKADAAKVAFNIAFRGAKGEMRPVIKNKSNSQTKSDYANLEAVSDALDPMIDKHGFAMTYGSGVATKEGHYLVTCDVLHIEGHERHYEAEIPADEVGIKGQANKTATHGFGSSMSYGRRYLKLMIWDIATKDDDGNGAGRGPGISAEQCAELRRLISQSGATEEAFCDYANCGTLPELPASDYNRAVGVLTQKIAKAKAS